jgi:hypothetical protein
MNLGHSWEGMGLGDRVYFSFGFGTVFFCMFLSKYLNLSWSLFLDLINKGIEQSIL